MTKPKKTTTTATEPASPLPRIVNSMKQAEALTGIPKPQIRFAKAQGSEAFTPGSRINLEELRAYVGTPEFSEAWRTAQEEDCDEWTKRLKRAQALRAEHQLERERAASWDAEQATILVKAGDAAIEQVLREWLHEKNPPLVAGKSAPEILKLNRDFVDALIPELNRARVAAMEEAAKQFPDDED